MEDKSALVRNYILAQLEEDALKEGDCLPGARALAKITGTSLTTVQNVLDIMNDEGILETKSRCGTFIRENWMAQRPKHVLSLQWSNILVRPEFQAAIRGAVPELWISQKFRASVFEIRTSHYIQSHHGDYLDLTEMFESCFPDRKDFITVPFEAFRYGRHLAGVPIIYSPRVIYYNPAIFTRAGCRIPEAGWDWNDFLDCIDKLQKVLPPDDVFPWNTVPGNWMTILLRAGGSLIDRDAEDRVRIDSPATRRGLRLYQELRQRLNNNTDAFSTRTFFQRFAEGKSAMLMAPREFMFFMCESGFDGWNTAPLPRIPGGRDVNLQAADLFCVRRECVDLNLAARLLKLMLSGDFQNLLAKWKYGIPVRKSAISRSIDYSDPRDVIFLTETPKIQTRYNLDSVELYNMVYAGISHLLHSDDDVDEAASQLANMVRVYLKICNPVHCDYRMSEETAFAIN